MKISAVVSAYNEEAYIGKCLTGLLRQVGIDDDFEIVIVDGCSSDRTLDVVRSFPEFGSRIRIVENRRRLQVYAWNLGWRAARGEYVSFISAHCTYDPHFLHNCLETMERTGATAVGPVQTPEGDGALGRAIAWCMSTPFGVGNARFRFTQCEEDVDSVFSMFLRRETLERLGGYDERVAFDEDDEFNYRLRASGGRIVVSPSLRVRYFVRNSFRGLARQMQCYGYWRRFTRILHPQRVPARVYAPPALVAALALSAFLALTPLRPLAALAPLAYAAFLALAIAKAARTIGVSDALLVAPALSCMHLSYGCGYWRALLTPQRRVLVGTGHRIAAH